MADLALVVAVTVGALAGAGLLTGLGLRGGDRPGDAEALVSLAWAGDRGPEAEVWVGNPSPVPVVVSARTRRAPGWAARLRHWAGPPAVSVRTTRRLKGSRPLPGTLLGVVDAYSRSCWRLPLCGEGAVRVTIRLDQGGGRARLVGHVLALPPRRPSPPAALRDRLAA